MNSPASGNRKSLRKPLGQGYSRLKARADRVDAAQGPGKRNVFREALNNPGAVSRRGYEYGYSRSSNDEEEARMTARQAPDAMPAMSDFLGIDPGASGGIALVGNGVVQAWAMPDTERDTYDFLKDLAPQVGMAYLERVSAMRGWGTSTTWKFGQHYGMLRAFLVALGIPFETVAPGVWQKSMGCLSHGDKRVTKARAQELFPHLNITHAVSDALLIAQYGYRQQRGGTP